MVKKIIILGASGFIGNWNLITNEGLEYVPKK